MQNTLHLRQDNRLPWLHNVYEVLTAVGAKYFLQTPTANEPLRSAEQLGLEGLAEE